MRRSPLNPETLILHLRSLHLHPPKSPKRVRPRLKKLSTSLNSSPLHLVTASPLHLFIYVSTTTSLTTRSPVASSPLPLYPLSTPSLVASLFRRIPSRSVTHLVPFPDLPWTKPPLSLTSLLRKPFLSLWFLSLISPLLQVLHPFDSYTSRSIPPSIDHHSPCTAPIPCASRAPRLPRRSRTPRLHCPRPRPTDGSERVDWVSESEAGVSSTMGRVRASRVVCAN